MEMMAQYITPASRKFRGCFVAEGKDIRFVGGCVRDVRNGVVPKDIDYATDATPDEQIAIYEKYGYRYITTGLAHGTITVLIGGETFEVTSLRIDSDHDGRWATVQYTRDWYQDAARRDLTFNSMSCSFDLELYDPFDGMADLEQGVVRFVGDAEQRIQEDYLRILRWFRFYGRFGSSWAGDNQLAEAAIAKHAPMLKGISRERIWAEVQKIIVNPRLYPTQLMKKLGVDVAIGAKFVGVQQAGLLTDKTKNPITILATLVGVDKIEQVAREWKMSRDEIKLAQTLVKFHMLATWSLTDEEKTECLREKLVSGYDLETITELAFFVGWPTDGISTWEVPVFPVDGHDLIAQFQGKELGEALAKVKRLWIDSDYKMTKDELLEVFVKGN